MEDDRPLTAKERRQEQIKRWANSATDLECATYTNPKIRVKFDDGAVFLAACSSGDLDEVESLLKNGADINFANVDGLTALHQACIDGNLEVVEFLVEHGSEIDHEDNEGWTPLHATASCCFMDIAKYLVKKGANVGAVNSEAELPLDIAEDDEMIEYLQSEIERQGIDVDEARDIERLVMLEDANALLDRYQNGEKIEIFRHQKSGATSLHIASAKGYNDVLKILIQAGMDVNAQDNDGWTPLHAASHWSQETSAKILADKNADFRARSKLGQTSFDVADEDMLEYLRDLETEQKENIPDIKPSPVIEPPPLKTEKSTPVTDVSGSVKINEIQNGEKHRKKVIDDSPESSSEESVPVPATQVTSLPPRSPASDAKSSYLSRHKDRTSSLTNEHTSEELSGGYSPRRNRPASLHITSTQEKTPHRPVSLTYSEGGSKPIAATQPVQSVGRGRENGGRTPTYAKDVSEDKDTGTPSQWRTGLRKTGSFDDKTKAGFQKSEVERSSSYSSSRFSDENKYTDNTKLARVAPILDARKTKPETETDEPVSNDTSSGYQKSTAFRRMFGNDTSSTTTTTSTTASEISTDPSASFKRSISYKKAVGRMESLENHDDSHSATSSRKPQNISRIPESTSETTTSASSETPVNDAAAAAAAAASKTAADHRRSHLQPVRDEEAEAQRRIRSRRERQSRRSTQGVTLDVYEEAMRTIGQIKKPATDKTSTEPSTDSKPNEITSSSRRNDENQTTSSSSTQSGYYSSTPANVGTPVTSLPSGYIPSDRRVKVNDSTAVNTKGSALNVPSITIDNTPSEGENDKGETAAENENSAVANRKSAAQQRRRNRNQRRSTGLPDLKPSSSATEVHQKVLESDQQYETAKREVVKTYIYKDYDSTPVASPYPKRFSTPETDLDWLRNLGRVTSRRKATQSASKSNSSSRFSHKDTFKRRSIECDLHPYALARKNGIEYPKELSPIRTAPKRPYGGYFTRNSLTPQIKNNPRYSTSFLELKDNLNTPQRRLSFDTSSSFISQNREFDEPFKKPKPFNVNDMLFKPGSTPPTSEKALSVKKLKKSVKELSACFTITNPVINFVSRKESEFEESSPFQFQGGGEGCLINKSLSSSKSCKHRQFVIKNKKAKGVSWPPENSNEAPILSEDYESVKRKLQFLSVSEQNNEVEAVVQLNNEVDEEETSLKDDVVDTAKMAYKYSSRRLLSTPGDEDSRRSPSPSRMSLAERLRMKYDSSSLPNRHDRHRTGVRGSDSDIPSRLAQPQTGDDSYSSSRNRLTDTKNYKKLYEENQVENERLRNELADAQSKVRELEARLEKAEENSVRRQALDKEKRERRALEDKVEKMEKEIQNSDSAEKIRAANGQLRAENNALHRIVEKLGGGTPDPVLRIIDEVPPENSSLLSVKDTNMKSESAPDLRKLEQTNNVETKRSKTLTFRRSSSSSSLSPDEEISDVRRGSAASSRDSDSLSKNIVTSTPDSSSLSGSPYSSLRRKARLEASTSSPSLLNRTSSPRRTAASNYTSSVSDYGRTSSFTPSRYTSSRREPSTLSNAPSYTIPISSSRRDFLKSLPSSTTSSHRTSSTSLRTTPTPYSSSYSKSSYGTSASSRPRHGYSSTSGRSDLSKYSSGLSGLSSSRRTKY